MSLPGASHAKSSRSGTLEPRGGEHLFVALSQYPWVTILLLVGITTLILTVKTLFDICASDIDATSTAF